MLFRRAAPHLKPIKPTLHGVHGYGGRGVADARMERWLYGSAALFLKHEIALNPFPCSLEQKGIRARGCGRQLKFENHHRVSSQSSKDWALSPSNDSRKMPHLAYVNLISFPPQVNLAKCFHYVPLFFKVMWLGNLIVFLKAFELLKSFRGAVLRRNQNV